MRAAARPVSVLAFLLLLPVACQDDLCLQEDEIFLCSAQEQCADGFLCDMERCICREARWVPAEVTQPQPGVDCAAKRRAMLEDRSKLEGRGPCRRQTDGT